MCRSINYYLLITINYLRNLHFRYFTTKKTAYTFYGDGSEAQTDDNVEGHEMKNVRNGGSSAPVKSTDDFDPDFSVAGTNGTATASQQLPTVPPANNPFRKDPTNNPFNQSNV